MSDVNPDHPGDAVLYRERLLGVQSDCNLPYYRVATGTGGEEGQKEMSDKQSQAESAGGEVSLVEQAGETTAADMVRGPEHTKPVGADTLVQVGGGTDVEEKGGESEKARDRH